MMSEMEKIAIVAADADATDVRERWDARGKEAVQGRREEAKKEVARQVAGQREAGGGAFFD